MKLILYVGKFADQQVGTSIQLIDIAYWEDKDRQNRKIEIWNKRMNGLLKAGAFEITIPDDKVNEIESYFKENDNE